MTFSAASTSLRSFPGRSAGGPCAAQTEAALYARAAGLLAGYGYPVEILRTRGRTAEQVVGAVLGLIQARMTTPAPSDERRTER